MKNEIINTRHPEPGKKNKNIGKHNYEIIKKAIINALRAKELTHTELVQNVEKSLNGKFQDNISWHTMTVKLDLEAGKIIERTSSKPQKYCLK